MMRMPLLEAVKSRVLVGDGAMGTQLIEAGLPVVPVATLAFSVAACMEDPGAGVMVRVRPLMDRLVA